MKPVKMEGNHGCFRACLATIFEYDPKKIPNFFNFSENTPDRIRQGWREANLWLSKNLNYKCICVDLKNDEDFYLEGVLCIAIGKILEEDHAVVWKDGLIHDPRRFINPPMGKPYSFVFFYPLVPGTGG